MNWQAKIIKHKNEDRIAEYFEKKEIEYIKKTSPIKFPIKDLEI